MQIRFSILFAADILEVFLWRAKTKASKSRIIIPGVGKTEVCLKFGDGDGPNLCRVKK